MNGESLCFVCTGYINFFGLVVFKIRKSKLKLCFEDNASKIKQNSC